MTGMSGLWTGCVCSVMSPRGIVTTSAARLVKGHMYTGCTWRAHAGTHRYIHPFLIVVELPVCLDIQPPGKRCENKIKSCSLLCISTL